jgi:hypothetical protein
MQEYELTGKTVKDPKEKGKPEKTPKAKPTKKPKKKGG